MPVTNETAALRAELVKCVHELHPLLRRNAAQTEKDRRVPDENIRAVEAAGLFRALLPKRYGGFELPVAAHLDVTAAIAEACPSTAWVVNLIGICGWFAALLPGRTQDEIFGRNPAARVAGVFTPSMQTERTDVEGGMVVSGKWYYASGCLHADWGLVGLAEHDAQGNVIEQFLAYIPMSDLRIEDTWHTVGMRGSGSNCLVAENVFVPNHRMHSVPRLLAGEYASEHKAAEPLYRSAFVPMAALILAGPQLGMGRAALEHVRSHADKRAITYTVYAKQSDSVAFQMQLAEAAMKVETAHLHAYRCADEIHAWAERDLHPGVLARARMRCDTSWAIRHITEALDLLITAHGAGSFAESSPMQRWWRDANTGARHAVALPQVSLEVYGKALLGLDTLVTPLV
ncbi:acyl-CoA dehydrogenase family protein [Variovorax sp. YR216]|uniref:acyl-CoA dehydrogenase family protein n=1 Tax=Variovorax sp. YR216 TaxID=1882828 RepID=UPI00089827D3|nr:acyl-CoA dehydrogenase family protein [Variovorax sp. YR216]SEB05419.1 Acyl-CoA dehydrogenase [Variovorax sp. YR216]